ncbi:hypothetical protein GDO86_019484 [Hymenochirus boettgeri]|uniref:Non-lysosomal glucosylceramidase n=1 Tax=Hymenochirus boettgeri TaxID=247094 RepID=A0A8T2ILM0_9PIPI|nr:hypothetical protein GDO86_019484 [Hymenochirus boettgeri]
MDNKLMERYLGKAEGYRVPTHGWRICLAHEFEEKRNPIQLGDVSLTQTLSYLPMGIRRRGQTVYQQVLSVDRPHTLQGWNWGYSGKHAFYHALYPRAWTVYQLPGQNVTLTCRQISPIIPNDYKDSSLPLALLIWDIENTGEEEAEVTIMFTMRNGSATETDRAGNHWNEPFHLQKEGESVKGVLLHHCTAVNPFTLGIGVREMPGICVSHCVQFDPTGMGQNLWKDLMEDGRLDSGSDPSPPTAKGKKTAGAVAAGCKVAPGGRQTLEFCLSWDMPRIRFGSGHMEHCRRYTRFFGSQGDVAPDLCHYGLIHYEQWEKKIEAWQSPILQDGWRDRLVEVPNDDEMIIYLAGLQGPDCMRAILQEYGQDEPWQKLNAYLMHDTAEWKDLNLKFVLQVFRDYHLTKNSTYLRDMWSICQAVMEAELKFDRNGDGLIENSGFADQTYDAWVMTGPSSYCGGLWLSAVCIMCEMADIGRWCVMRSSPPSCKGKEAFERLLWNGLYLEIFNYDCSDQPYFNSVMSDQCAGHWFLRAVVWGLGKVRFSPMHVVSAHRASLSLIVKQFADGQMGAVNGMRPDGTIDKSSIQSEEIWIGVVYGLAATMIHEPKVVPHSLGETGDVLPNTRGVLQKRTYRSLAYMRPLSIWAMQLALQDRVGSPTQQNK